MSKLQIQILGRNAELFHEPSKVCSRKFMGNTIPENGINLHFESFQLYDSGAIRTPEISPSKPGQEDIRTVSSKRQSVNCSVFNAQSLL